MAGTHIASEKGSEYIYNVNKEISHLVNEMNAFQGFKTKSDKLKGDIAEFWHSDTFNIDAIIKDSNNRTHVDRSHDLASPDITSNFGDTFGLKYYKSGTESAKQQAKSIFERFKEYQAQGGKNSLDEFLQQRGYKDIDSILNDPIYSGQIRIIPKDQLADATKWLERKINTETLKRPEQVERYQETLKILKDKLEDDNGTKSIALSKDDAEQLATLAKKGEVTESTLENLGVSTEELIKYEYVLKQAFKAGITSATISIVLKTVPEIYKVLTFLIKNGQLDEKQFKKIGFSALQGGTEGFLRGSISAAITTVCKAGLIGETWKDINPAIVGVVTVIAIDTAKNAFRVATGKMQTRCLANELVKEMFISTISLIGGGLTQSIIEIPVLGFMIGSFIGSIVGSFAYNIGYNATISFCINTGFTMFGLVEQNYELPNDVLESIGVDVFKYEEFEYKNFKYEEFKYNNFQFEEFNAETLDIKILRRGVIGVQKIGYLVT